MIRRANSLTGFKKSFLIIISTPLILQKEIFLPQNKPLKPYNGSKIGLSFSIFPQKPYYYANVLSKSDSTCAPDGCENVFILCPVPDLRFKKDWDDKEELAKTIIEDLSKRIDFDLTANTLVKKILAPDDWANMLNLYKGSGLGLAHDINQVGAFRPKNKDEHFSNLYYVGASTTPGTGLPMVVISSRLVTERILNDTTLS